MNYPFAVFVSYPLSAYEWGSLDKPITELAEAHGGRETGGGTGFGCRDIDCEFQTEFEVTRFTTAVERQFDGCVVSVAHRRTRNR